MSLPEPTATPYVPPANCEMNAPEELKMSTSPCASSSTTTSPLAGSTATPCGLKPSEPGSPGGKEPSTILVKPATGFPEGASLSTAAPPDSATYRSPVDCSTATPQGLERNGETKDGSGAPEPLKRSTLPELSPATY